MNYELKFKNKKEIKNFSSSILYVLNGYELAEQTEKNLKSLRNKLNKLLNKKSIKNSSRKAKGRELQKWVCERIADIFDIIYDQSDDRCDIHSREMGQKGCDVILRGELYNKFKFDIECKSTENFHIYNDIEQAKNNKEINRDWLLVHKKKNKTPIVVMDWECFENLIKKTIY